MQQMFDTFPVRISLNAPYYLDTCHYTRSKMYQIFKRRPQCVVCDVFVAMANPKVAMMQKNSKIDVA